MRRGKRISALALSLSLALPVCAVHASAKTVAAGQTVETVLFYVKNSAGEDILASQIPVSEMEADLEAGVLDDTNHNYSLLDRYVTTVHQEGQGFTVPEFVSYAQSKSTLDSVKDLDLDFAGEDKISFWEIDQTGFDELDTYSCDDFYGVARYNFPLLYEYWDYRTQTYADPAGVMSKEEIIDHIFEHGEPETVLLSVRAFSQRYMVSDKYDTGDYNMENLWLTTGVMDNQRTIRLMKPMTEEELRNQTSTAADTRYWTANILLDMENDPEIASLGEVAAPTAVMTEDEENYYISFACATPGAAILYNHNYWNPSYTPSSVCDGSVAIPKSAFPSGTVTMTCRAVKEGYTDPGVTTLTLTAAGTPYQNPYSDVADSQWYSDAVRYVTEHGLFDPASEGTFGLNAPMTRLMLAEALYRLSGSPQTGDSPFQDCAAPAVAWAYEMGVVNGLDKDTFAPDGGITREQIVAMFYRYAANVAGLSMTSEASLSAFTDGRKVAAWAQKEMEWAVDTGLMTGTSETILDPQGTATRAQAAALVQRLVNYMAGNLVVPA